MERQHQWEIGAAARAAAQVYLERHWTWGHSTAEGVSILPQEGHIAAVLCDLVGLLLENDSTSVSTGRLFAERDDDGTITLSVEIGTLESLEQPPVQARG